jgi:DNA-binding MarR family transcriptional regulator
MRLGKSVGDAAREASRASAAFDEAVVAFVGINLTDGRACDALDQYGQLSAGELAEHLGITTGAVTTLIDRLERVGMVERLRDDSDRRRVYVRPTDLTRRIFAAIYAPYEQAWADVARGFTDEEMRAARTYERMSRDLNAAFAALMREVTPAKSATSEERAEAAAARLKDFDVGQLRLKREDDQ